MSQEEINPKTRYKCPKCGSLSTHLNSGRQNKSNKGNMLLNKTGIRCSGCGYIVPPAPKKSHLKPWKDPESLFCDTGFLKKLFNKEPTPGKECKDT